MTDFPKYGQNMWLDDGLVSIIDLTDIMVRMALAASNLNLKSLSHYDCYGVR